MKNVMLAYTVVRPFTFRGMEFMAGDLFDPNALECPPHRCRVLTSQRFIAPGYSEQNTVSQPQKTKTQASAQPKASEPEKANSEPDGGNEPETPENGEPESADDPESEPEDAPEDNADEEAIPRRVSRRRS